MGKQVIIVCKSVLKGRDEDEIRRECLRRWVEMIHYVEKVNATAARTR